MIFSKGNVFIITLTTFIVFDMTTNAANEETGTNPKQGSYNSGMYTTLTTMPTAKWNVVQSGSKQFYLGTFFKANWFDSMAFCRYHGMQLASITSEQENADVVKQMQDFGYSTDSHFWTSGNDLSNEGSFVWLGNGQNFRYTNWLTGEPNNVKDDKGNDEDCVEFWYKGEEGFKWNDKFCTFEANFICELV
ncbi:C-type lectin 37Db-like [Melanaphis sacchari]|uniref:Perlucin-like protein n=1 Tax=Melanaphis sacchari TaxID=742174 RepID=A0A2H8TGW9_9HEMI|nr:C-type lectin 37Db-like [Melanaphis sacchari]